MYGYGPPPPAKPEPMAIAMEAILAIFGIYGVGWMMSGKTTVGALLMVGGILWIILVILGSIFTAGLGACCLIPIHLIFITASTVALANQTVTR